MAKRVINGKGELNQKCPSQRSLRSTGGRCQKSRVRLLLDR